MSGMFRGRAAEAPGVAGGYPAGVRRYLSTAMGRRAGSRRVLALLFLSLLAVPTAWGHAAARETGTPSPVTGALAVAGQSSLPGVLASRVSSGAGDVHQTTPAAADNGSAPAAAGQSGQQADATDPAAAAEPGRQADPPPAAPATRSPVGAYEPAILRTFECPRRAIARMLSSAVAEGEFSEALELEREVLILWRDRQAILKELVGSEIELARALHASAAARAEEELRLETAREAEALRLETMRREADARVRAAHEAILEASRAELARKEAAEAEARAAAAAPPAPETPAPVREPPRDYGWFAVMGSGADLRAAVTDGRNVWRVEAGDRLPGGVVVRAVEARPPGVRVTGWRTDRLPYRSRASR